MAGQHGGARPGAGRPANSEVHAGAITRFTDLAARGLSQNFDNLCTLADGGYERTESKLMPAGLITRKAPARDANDNVIRDDKGKPTLVEVLVYPDLPADQLVVIEQKRITLAPDFRANEYLVNRVMGTPSPAREPDPEGLNLAEALERARAKALAYRDPDDEPEPEPEPEPGGDDGA